MSEFALVQSSYVVNEGDMLAVEVLLMGFASQTTSIQVQTATMPTGAQPGIDFTPVDQTLFFMPGEMSQMINIEIIDDGVWRPNRDFEVRLVNPMNGPLLGIPNQAVITIVDDEPQPAVVSLAVDRQFVNEGDSVLMVSVLRSGGLQPVTVDLAPMAVPGGATPGVDFDGDAQTVFLNGGSTVQMELIPIFEDNLFEGDEDFAIALVNPSPTVVLNTPDQALVTIVDNDPEPAILSLEANRFFVNEGDGALMVSVQRAGGLADTVFVELAAPAIPGGATPGVDYDGSTQLVMFPAGSADPQIVMIPILEDTLFEGDEDFGLALANPGPNAVLNAPDQALVTIVENDPEPAIINLEVGRLFVDEDAGALQVDIARSGGLTEAVSVDLATMQIPGGATPGVDYDDTAQTVMFPAGSAMSQTVMIPIFDDAMFEGDEDFGVALVNPGPNVILGVPDQALVTIVENDPEPSIINLEVNRHFVNEGDGALQVSILRGGGITEEVTVDLLTTVQAPKGATPGLDYGDTAETVIFPAGSAAPQIVTIPILEDALFEGDEDFGLTLVNPGPHVILNAPTQALVTIVDNDPQPSTLSLEAGRQFVNEGDGALQVVVLRAGGLDEEVSVDLTTIPTPNGATPGLDYAETVETVIFPAGSDDPQTVLIPILEDTLFEGDEDFRLALVNPSANGTINQPEQALVTIVDNDAEPNLIRLALPQFQTAEGDGDLIVEVVRSGGLDTPSDVRFATVAIVGGATPGEDYQVVGEDLHFEPGETSLLVEIPIVDDPFPEPRESFRIELSNPSGASLGQLSQALVNIDDDDGPGGFGSLRFTAPLAQVSEGSGPAILEVARTGGLETAVGVTVATRQLIGEAASGDDYVETQQTLSFAAGEAGPMTVEIDIIDDGQPEGVELFEVALSNPTGGATLANPSVAQVAIIDDDEPQETGAFRFVVDELAVSENIGDAVIEVVRVNGADAPASVLVSTRRINGGADAGADFIAFQETLSFAAGETGPLATTVSIVDDDAPEGVEAFEAVLSNPSNGAALTDPRVLEISILDDDGSSGELRFIADRVVVDERDGEAIVEVVRAGDLAGQASVVVETIADDGADPFEDFTPVRETVIFEGGDPGPRPVAIPILNDSQREGPEAFSVVLTEAIGAAIGLPDIAAVIITDNDARPVLSVRWQSANQTVVEDDDPTKRAVSLDITAVLSEPAPMDLEVPFQVTGNATPGEDHNLAPGSLFFEAGALEASLAFNIIGDLRAEPVEFIGVVLEEGPVPRAQPFVHIVEIEDNDAFAELNTVIVSPAFGQLFANGAPIRFEAAVGNPSPGAQYQFFWEVCKSTGDCGETQERVFELTLDDPGLYIASCFAVDDNGNVDPTPDEVRFMVEGETCPEATIVVPGEDAIVVNIGETVRFVGEIEGSPQPRPAWFLVGSSAPIGQGFTLNRRFDRRGEFALVFRDLNAPSDKAFDYVQVLVTDDPPVRPRIVQPADRAVVDVGEPVQFIGSLEGPPAKMDDVQVIWTTGDGAKLQGLQPNPYAYDRPGVYKVKLAAVKGREQRFLDEIILNVRDRDRAPEVNFNFPSNLRIQPGDSVFFKAVLEDGQGRSSRDLRFIWDFGDGRRSYSRTPGRVTFDAAGEFVVTLIAVDAQTGKQSQPATRVILARPTADADFEPNESLAQAAVISPGNYANLVLDDDSLVDVYQLSVSRSGQRLVVAATAEGLTLAELFNAAGDKLGEAQFTGDFEAQLQDLPAGDYFVRFTQVTQAGSAKRASLGYSFGISVLNPALYLPDIQETDELATQIGLVNTVNDFAWLDVIGFDANGNLVDSVQFELAPLGRTHRNVSDLFPDQAREIAWIQVDSDKNLVGYSRSESRDAKEVYAVSASAKLSSELFVPHIADQVEQWFTRASVINGVDQSSSAQILTPAEPFELQVNKAFSRDNFDFLERFGGVLPAEKMWASFAEAQAQPALAGAEVFGTLSEATRMTAGLQLRDIRRDNPNFTYIGRNLYFTHIARDTALFWTGIALVNINNVAVDTRITGYDSAGAAVSVIRTLQPNEKVVELADLFLQDIGAPTEIDWVMVEADADIVGFELFGTHDRQRIAGLEAATALRTELCYPFIDVSPDVAHGISVVNVNDQEADLVFTLYDDDGVALASVPVKLGAKRKLSVTIEDLFADAGLEPDDIPGWLGCQSTLPVAGFELFLDLANNEQLGALVAQ